MTGPHAFTPEDVGKILCITADLCTEDANGLLLMSKINQIIAAKTAYLNDDKKKPKLDQYHRNLTNPKK